jgi:hypothetical protein
MKSDTSLAIQTNKIGLTFPQELYHSDISRPANTALQIASTNQIISKIMEGIKSDWPRLSSLTPVVSSDYIVETYS